MIKHVQQYGIFALVLCVLFLIPSKITAQEVYFAEDPPMVLDGKIKRIPDFIVEYSAKNNGIIQLELVQNKQTVVGKGTFAVKKRGSNTATINLNMLHADRTLAPGTNYEYRLTLFENANTKKASTKSANRMGLNTSFAPTSKSTLELKKVGKTTVVKGVKVL